jgi:hypothetical protein
VLSSNQGEFLTELIVFVDKTQYEGSTTTGGITVETALQAGQTKSAFFNFGGDFYFFSYYIHHCFICRPLDSTVSTDAGIELRTVATGALAVRRSNHYC